jgi:dienelactone hydrolase
MWRDRTSLAPIRARAAAALGRLFVAAALLASGSAVAAAEQWMTLAGLRVAVWSAPETSDATHPVIVFSHGFLGCATQSRFLMEAFAEAGYLVFAPNHRDALCVGDEVSWPKRAMLPWQTAAQWTDSDFRDRADDIVRVLTSLRTEERFRGNVDLSHIGLVGHSLGGYTVLGLSGAWPSWQLAGVSAVLALSPYVEPFVEQKTLGRLAVPVMYQGGSLDFMATPLHKASGAYDQSPSPKYLVEFDLASHWAWTNIGFGVQDRIVLYSLAFMDAYVRSRSRDAELTASMHGVALRHAEPLVEKAASSRETDESAATSPAAH